MVNITFLEKDNFLKQSLLIAATIFLCLIAGLVSSLGSTFLAAVLAGIVVATGLVIWPVALLMLTTFFVLVAAGTVKYFFGFDRIWWIAYGMAMLLFLPAAMTVFYRNKWPHHREVLRTRYSLIFLLLLAVMSSIIAASPLPQIIVATKSFIMFGGVWAIFTMYDVKKSTVKKWLFYCLVIAMIQIIPALYQYIFVRSARQDMGLGTVSAADSVVGTFGGSMESGGLTAVLAIYMLFTLVALIAMYRHNVIPKAKLNLLLPFIIIPLALVEVKALFILLPVACVVLYRDVIFKSPAKALFGLIAGGLILFSFLLIYQVFHWASSGMSFSESVVQSFSYSFNDETGYFSSQQGEITRKFAYILWIENHGFSNLKELLIGHGFGASRTQGAVLGETALMFYPLHIDRVGWVMILWDFGLMGFLSIVSIFAIAFINAGRAIRDTNLESWERGLGAALQAFIPVIFLSMMYRNDVPYAAPMMFIVMSIFGLIAWLNNQRGIAKGG